MIIIIIICDTLDILKFGDEKNDSEEKMNAVADAVKI